MSVRRLLLLASLSATPLLAIGKTHQMDQDVWLSNHGKVRITEADSGQAWLIINGKRQHKFPTRAFLLTSFRPSGPNGFELFLLQVNAADSAWFHVLEVREDGSFVLSPMFGNGGDLPKIQLHEESLHIEFAPLDLPRGKVEGQTWRFENGQLTKLH